MKFRAADSDQNEFIFEMINEWNDRFGDEDGYFVMIGLIKLLDEGDAVMEMRPRMAVSPIFSAEIPLDTQARIYQQFVEMFQERITRCKAGINPDAIPQ